MIILASASPRRKELLKNITSDFKIVPSSIEEIVPSGENYLVQIDPTSVGRKKTVHLKNLRYKKEKPFLASKKYQIYQNICQRC